MKRFISSFISSNDPDVDSPDVSQERKTHNKQINQFHLNPKSMTGSDQRKSVNVRLIQSVNDSEEIQRNSENVGANDGDADVAYVELDDSHFRNNRLRKDENKSSLCDLLRTGQTNQAPSFIK